MRPFLSRSEFIKFSGLSLSALALGWLKPTAMIWPPGKIFAPKMTGRVTARFINLYTRPNFNSKRISQIKRDTILNLVEEVTSPDGPGYNPLWYRLENGFIHSGYVQRVEKAHLNEAIRSVSEGGQLGEVTVPYTQSRHQLRSGDWSPLYRLYYESVHWITSILDGPDGMPWYELTDELLHVQYCIPAVHMRPIQAGELEPLAPSVPPEDKRIEISLGEQTLTAFEKDRVVLHTKISSGVPDQFSDVGEGDEDDIPTETPIGIFRVQVKVPSKHMGDGLLTDDIEAYELVGVPWVSFFYKTGVALHGTYWHNNFGRKMSHGCVNLPNDDAKWLYRWTTPVAESNDLITKGYGSVVKIVG